MVACWGQCRRKRNKRRKYRQCFHSIWPDKARDGIAYTHYVYIRCPGYQNWIKNVYVVFVAGVILSATIIVVILHLLTQECEHHMHRVICPPSFKVFDFMHESIRKVLRLGAIFRSVSWVFIIKISQYRQRTHFRLAFIVRLATPVPALPWKVNGRCAFDIIWRGVVSSAINFVCEPWLFLQLGAVSNFPYSFCTDSSLLRRARAVLQPRFVRWLHVGGTRRDGRQLCVTQELDVTSLEFSCTLSKVQLQRRFLWPWGSIRKVCWGSFWRVSSWRLSFNICQSFQQLPRSLLHTPRRGRRNTFVHLFVGFCGGTGGAGQDSNHSLTWLADFYQRISASIRQCLC